MSIHLIRDLDHLHKSVMTMCARVEDMIHAAVDALQKPDFERARAVIQRDDEIDRMDVQIEEECLKLLALHQPVAIDLRRITSVLKIGGELERVADLGVSIAERACGIVKCPEIAVPDNLKDMSRQALDMLHRSIDAYVHLDVQTAREVCLQDDAIDKLNREIIDELTGLMQRRPELIEPAIHMFSASRQIERIADHATNIAEDVIYLVQGDIVRHRSRGSLPRDSASPAGSSASR